jgi:3-methyladenine DNA glycosylase AlkC
MHARVQAGKRWGIGFNTLWRERRDLLMNDLLADFAAAFDTASFEAFEAALHRFKRLKEIKGNGTLEIGFLMKTVKPLGLAAGRRMAGWDGKRRADWLKRLATDEKAAARCLAGYVLGEVGKADPVSIVSVAYKLAKDDRPEVRECLANVFDEQIGPAHPEFVYDLMRRWVSDSSPNVRRVPTTALIRYGIGQPGKVIALMDRLRHDESESVRKNVKVCLQQIARQKLPAPGPGSPDNPDVMLAALGEWADDPDPNNRWIVAGALGSGWARDRLPQALAILRRLALDEDKLVRGAVVSAMRELAKHDREAVQSAAAAWARAAEPNVRLAGERVLKKVD